MQTFPEGCGLRAAPPPLPQFVGPAGRYINGKHGLVDLAVNGRMLMGVVEMVGISSIINGGKGENPG